MSTICATPASPGSNICFFCNAKIVKRRHWWGWAVRVKDDLGKRRILYRHASEYSWQYRGVECELPKVEGTLRARTNFTRNLKSIAQNSGVPSVIKKLSGPDVTAAQLKDASEELIKLARDLERT